MKVRGKVLHGVPFLHQAYRRLHTFKAGKLRIVYDDVRGLQARILGLPVNDELSAEHPEIWIGLFAVRNISIRKILRIGRSMESVASGVNADEAEAVLDGIEKTLFAFGGHRRLAIGTRLCKVTGGEKHDGSVVMKFLGVKEAAVLRSGEIEFVLSRETADSRFNDGGIARRGFYDGVLKSGRFCEQQYGFVFRSPCRIGKEESGTCSRSGSKKIASCRERIHFVCP